MKCERQVDYMLNTNLEDTRNLMIEKLEDAYKIFKISEVYLKDVSDDYGKQKIAKLRYDFAKHRLAQLWEEASKIGIEWGDSEIMRNSLLKRKGND